MAGRIAGGSVLKLIKQTLKAGMLLEGQVVPVGVGVPQGSPISPLYSNIYLNVIDQAWHRWDYPQPGQERRGAAAEAAERRGARSSSHRGWTPSGSGARPVRTAG